MKALITGASSGMGRDMAINLSQRGYELILVARDEMKLKEVANSIEKNTQVIVMDLSEEKNCIELYNQVKEQQIDIVINNAGFGVYGEFTQTSLEKELSLIKTNIEAVHILTKLFLQDMKKRNSGIILNVASSAAFMPGPLMSCYYASKSYVLRLSEGIREELRKEKSKVQISVLCPGPVSTNFSKAAGVNFGIHSLNSKQVADYTIAKMLKGKFMIVPGILMKLVRIVTKITPNNIVSKFAYRVNFTKKK